MTRFILHNFEKTQMNIVILYLTIEGLYQLMLMQRKRGIFLLAVGICLKVLPIAFIPYLIYRKKIGAVIGIVLVSACLLLTPSLVFGFQ
ncbi:glycosyltransferase 87 family protein, partial [Vibrio parahaemolyticus]